MTTRALLAVCAVLAAAPALASSTFPVALRGHLSLAGAPPPCALCHTNGITGPGTVNTPFGRALRMRGAVGLDEARLRTALDTMRTDAVDSDGDGAPDIVELESGTDPNVPDGDGGTGQDGGAGGGGGDEVFPPPRYGCGASAVPGLWVLGSVVALLSLARRRRR